MGVDAVDVEATHYRSCKICDSNRLEALFTSAQSQLPVLKCRACGLVFVGRIFDAAAQTAFYNEADYYQAFAEAERSVVDMHDRHKAWVDAIRQQLSVFHASDARRQPRLLDIGCGAGGFLAVARERGFDVRGQDISRVAARLALEWNNIHVESIELQQIEANSAEVVTLIGSLEHVTAPRETLQQAHRILVANGLLFIYTPVWGTYDTIATLLARMSRSRFMQPADTRVNHAHLQIFARSTLVELLQRIGFKTFACDAVCEYNLPVREYLNWFGITQPGLQSVALKAAQFLIDHKLFFQNNMRVMAYRN